MIHDLTSFKFAYNSGFYASRQDKEEKAKRISALLDLNKENGKEQVSQLITT